ncbi:MAG: hypothetical protein KF754_12335 [Planctomycetes bacterium]|nr:hypothetical protein [Planctomycetota bacterium]
MVEDIARSCEMLGRHEHPGTAAARNVAAGLQAALLEYEIALAGANRHTFGDRRRTRPREPLFLQPHPAMLAGTPGDTKAHAFILLNSALARLEQVVGNLQIRTDDRLPDDMSGTHDIDRGFLRALTPVVQQLDADLTRIHWRIRRPGPGL